MRRFILLLFAALMLTVPALAEDVPLYDTDQMVTALPEAAAEQMEGFSPTEQTSLGGGARKIFGRALESADSAVAASARTAALVVVIVLLCALVSQMQRGVSQDAVLLAGALAVTVACAADLNSMIALGRETLGDMQGFSNVLLPTMAAATVAVGAANTSASIYVATVFFSNVAMQLINRLFLPLTYLYVAASCADAALGNEMLKRFTDLIKFVITNGLKLLVIVFLGYLTVTGAISGSADAATVKAAKLTISTAVPVIGSIIADASETVLVSAGLLRSSVGVFGMLAVLSICIGPFLRLGIQYLMLKLAAAASSVIGEKPLVRLVDSLSSAMGFLLGMTGACALILLISCVCSMKAVSL